MNRSPESRAAVASASIVTVILVAVAGALPALAQDVARTNLIIKDSSTDRTPVRTSIPTYPKIARRDRIEGDATVCFRIDFNGRIRSVRVENYTHRIFRRPSLKAIRESSFEPLKPHEILNTSRTCRTYRFRLEPVMAENGESAN